MTEDEVTLQDIRMWEDEQIFYELENGLNPWVFGNNDVTA